MCLQDPWGDAQSPGEGPKPCPGQGIRGAPRLEVLGFAAGCSSPGWSPLPAGPALGLH